MIFLPLAFLTAAALAWGCNALELIPWRRAAGAHWTERARKLYPARQSRGVNLTMIPACLTLLAWIVYPDLPWGLVLAAAFPGTLLGNFPMDAETNPGLRFAGWTHQVISSWTLQLGTWGIYLAATLLMPIHHGWATWAVTAGFVVVFLAQQFGATVRLLRGMGLFKPARPRLQALVDATSATMGVLVRATWEITSTNANAFALVTTRDLAFTTKLIEVGSDDELKAICAHELGHLTEGRWTLAGRLLGASILFPVIFVRPAYGWAQETGLACLGFVMLLIWWGNLKLAQAMENRADKVARESVEETGMYARALELLYRTNLMPAVLKDGSGQIHPNLYDRMVSAGLTPDYPRPPAPASRGWTGIVVTVITVLAIWIVMIWGW